MKISQILYYLFTALFSLIMCYSVYNYFVNNAMIVGFFEAMGYPTYLVYPLAIAKILGLLALWVIPSKALKEWAYAGFFFNVVLAFFAHYMIDQPATYAIYAFIFLVLSYVLWKATWD